MARDNFLKPVKEALAKRAGNRCSYPGCNATTIGPSDEGENAVSNTGTAAHISAASGGQGSRRYDPNMLEEQRTAIDNGIWCCRNHGTLIDTDEVTYSSAMLRGWRAIAEKKAQLRQSYGDIQFECRSDLTNIGLISERLILDLTFTNDTIGNAILFCGVTEIWGRSISDSVRDFLIEYSRNAFQHGKATTTSIEFVKNGVVVKDNGTRFNLHPLSAPNFGRGGGLAYRALLSTLRINAVSTKFDTSNQNILHLPLVKSINDLFTHNPCALAVTHEQMRLNTFDFSVIADCDRAYLVTPNFMTYSDAPWCERMLEAAIASHGNIILVIPQASAAVLKHYQERFCNTEVISW